MTLLVTGAELIERRRIARGSLAPLADSLSADLERLVSTGVEVPVEKARLSRAGGRCPEDGTPLEYDPWSPRAHRCPRCGRVWSDAAHYRYWLMWHQLWLAERSVHASTLFALRGDERHRDLALSILGEYSERYLEFPNRDNVLGPSRVFFSTYLESIWLLQLCTAIDLLESTGVRHRALDVARERIVAPASSLIASYDEGTSNRQAWNVAALLAGAIALGDTRRAEQVVTRGHGLRFLVETALLPDGSWYEGENYHVFAHRGLWYGLTMAERAGLGLDAELTSRFDRGFALPFRTALPDMTMLARRDSQHAISLRQWRFAELCELGLARRDDPELRAALAQLYAADIRRADSGRSRSSAEAERHSPASALTRADLGWRSLLHAREQLPPLEGATPRSVLLRSQGLGILRRDGGRLFAAMDYGESGGGHGHPDRLNIMLCDGVTRWLDDPGTGSYVDRSLHWYRSTLAHSAPIADRRSQPPVAGRLLAWDERGAAGWIAAASIVGASSIASRRLVAMHDYIVDELSWTRGAGHRTALPFHIDVEVPGLDWTAAPLGGAGGLEDGFDFVERAEVAEPSDWPIHGVATDRGDGATADVWLGAPAGTQLWRVVAPGAPGQQSRRFMMLESMLPRGTFTTVIAPRRTISAVSMRDASIIVEHRDGSVHEHAGGDRAWRIALRAAGATSSIELGGAVPDPELGEIEGLPAADQPGEQRVARTAITAAMPFTVTLGEADYRRSEETWQEAGRPTAIVTVAVTRGALVVTVDVRGGPAVLLPDGAVNEMDNEQPDVNASGMQLSIHDARGTLHRWLARPTHTGGAITRALSRDAAPLDATSRIESSGWRLRCELPLHALGDASPYFIALGVTVNEIPPGRERRRGQLVLGGASGEWVYLRGDRDDPSKLLPILID